MGYQGKLTVKGQVTIPLAMRRALGLQPGDTVDWELDEAGRVRITKAESAAADERRKADFRARLKQAQACFKDNDAFPGMDTDKFMALIREPLHDFEVRASS